MIVFNMISNKNNTIPNQFIIHDKGNKYFVDIEDMRLFRAEYKIIKKVVNKLKENK